MGVLAVEMEAAALYMNAARGRQKGALYAYYFRSYLPPGGISAMERQIGFGKMMEIALELA